MKEGSEHQDRRVQEKICIGGEPRHDHLVDEKGSRTRFSLAEYPGELLQRQTDEGDSEHQQRRIQKKICVGGESGQDQLIDVKRSKSGSSSAEDPGELLHRHTEKGSFGTSTSEDPGEDLHRWRTTAGSPRRRKRIKAWIFNGTGSRRSSSSSEKWRRDLLPLQNQVVEFLVISNSPRCSLGLFPSEVGSVLV